MKHTKLAAFAAATALALGTASCSQQKEDVAPSRLHQVAGASDTDDDTPPDPDGDTPQDPDESTPVDADYDLPEDGDPAADNNVAFNATAVGGRKVKVSFTLPYPDRSDVSYRWEIRTTFQRNPATQSPSTSGAYPSSGGRRTVELSFNQTGVWTISLYQTKPGGRAGVDVRVLASRNVTVY